MMIDVYGENKTIYSNQYVGVIIVFFGLLFVIGKVFLHKDINSEQAQAKMQVHTAQTVVANSNIAQSKTITPKFRPTPQLKPLRDVLKHTAVIGTADNPTIDGGFINAADGVPVAPGPITSTRGINVPQYSAKENTLENNPQKLQGKNSGIFHDEWATSSRVREFLRSAAKEGKLSYVLDKTEEKGLPASVAVVPMVESNYQTNATSNKGAGGVWQLMPTAAKDYGLNNNERYKFEPSTEAALTLLQDLHKQFDNWELAFAAYNAGAERVEAALQKNPQAQSVQELDLPKETKDYVKHIVALNKTMESL